MTIEATAKLPRPSKEQRIDMIVAAARGVFCSSGFEKGSIVEIAAGAGIAEGTIYRYFDGKRGLLDEVLRRHYSEVFDDIKRAMPSIEGHGNRLRYLIRRVLLAISADRGMCGLITRDMRQFEDGQPSSSKDLNRQISNMMAGEIKAGIKSGAFRADTSPRITCDMIGGGLQMTAWAFMKHGKPIDIEGVTDSISKIVLSGIDKNSGTTVSLAALVDRLETTANRLDCA